MIYRVFHPSPALCHIVDHYWYASAQQEIKGSQYFYTPLLQTLAFNFKQKIDRHSFNGNAHTLDGLAYFFGQSTSPREIYTEGNGLEMVGIKFKATGIAQLTGVPMTEIADKIIPVEDLWGRELDLICDEIQSASDLENAILALEKFLLHKINTVKAGHRIDNIAYAVSLIKGAGGNIDMNTMQHRTNTSRKTLERGFMNCVGLTPKMFACIAQFNAAKIMMDTRPLLSVTNIALEAGYYDSSHFSAAFKRFSGMTPTHYLEMWRAEEIENAYFRENNTASV